MPLSLCMQRILAFLVLFTLCSWRLPHFLQKVWQVLGTFTPWQEHCVGTERSFLMSCFFPEPVITCNLYIFWCDYRVKDTVFDIKLGLCSLSLILKSVDTSSWGQDQMKLPLLMLVNFFGGGRCSVTPYLYRNQFHAVTPMTSTEKNPEFLGKTGDKFLEGTVWI